jgi:hypothetical protein
MKNETKMTENELFASIVPLLIPKEDEPELANTREQEIRSKREKVK